MIRAARDGDVPAIFALGQKAHGLSLDRDIPIDPVRARTYLVGLIYSKDGLVLVDEVDGAITGVLIGLVDGIWYSRQKFGIAMLTYAERRGAFAWMVRRFRKWALEQKGAAEVIFDASFGGEMGKKTERILPRLGFEHVGGNYIAR